MHENTKNILAGLVLAAGLFFANKIIADTLEINMRTELLKAERKMQLQADLLNAQANAIRAAVRLLTIVMAFCFILLLIVAAAVLSDL